MKSFCASFALVLAAWAAGSTVAAQTPQVSAPTLVRLDGQLQTPTGQPRTGDVLMVVSLYAGKDDVTPLWIEQQLITLDAAGRYTVYAGATLPEGLPKEHFVSNSAHWLGIAVQSEPEQPRVMLVSMPYALKAADADTLGGRAVTDFVLSDKVSTSLKSSVSGTSSTTSGTGTNALAGPGTSAITANFIQKSDGTATGTTNSIMYDDGTNVGVGTASPTAKATIQGSSTNDYHNFQFAIQDSSTNSKSLRLGYVAGTGLDLGVVQAVNSGTAYQNLALNPYGGNVGIGTTSPGAKLEVNSHAAGYVSKFIGGAGNFFVFNPAGSAYEIGTGGNANLHLDTGATIRMTIDTGGNVGIGTTAPSYRLDVSGDANITGTYRVNGVPIDATSKWTQAGSNIYYTTGNVGIGTTTPTAQLQVVGSTGIAVDAGTASGAAAVFASCLQANTNCYALEGFAPTGDYAAYMFGGRGVYAQSDDAGFPGVDAHAFGTSSYAIRAESNAYRGGYVKSNSGSDYSLYVDTQGGPTQAVAGLNVRGGVRVEGDLVVLGSKTGYVVDIMQNLDSAPLEPGDVVVIVGNGPPVLGQIPVVTVKKATSAYDTGAAGVVDAAWYAPDPETNAAYALQEQAVRAAMSQRASAQAVVGGAGIKAAEVKMPEVNVSDAQGTLHALPDVASTGTGGYVSVVTLGSFRIVKADAGFGAIQAGDLLTTSANPGYAMKVTDKVAAIGAIIGKALGTLDSGTGTIPILVMPK